MEMDEHAMIDLSLLPLSVTLPVFLLGGLVLGYAYFRAVRATADLVISQGNPLHAAALTLGRLALLFAGFYLAVQVGGLALLAALAGVLGARALMLLRTRSAGI
jgi:hypothetical protein